MTRPWKPGTWKGQIVEGRAKGREEAISQRAFQAEMVEEPARRQDVSVIPWKGEAERP